MRYYKSVDDGRLIIIIQNKNKFLIKSLLCGEFIFYKIK